MGSATLRRRKMASVLPLAAPSSEMKMSVQFLRLISCSNRQKDPAQLPPVVFCWYQAPLFTRPERTGQNPAAATVGKNTCVCPFSTACRPRAYGPDESLWLKEKKSEETSKFESCLLLPSVCSFQMWLIEANFRDGIKKIHVIVMFLFHKFGYFFLAILIYISQFRLLSHNSEGCKNCKIRTHYSELR